MYNEGMFDHPLEHPHAYDDEAPNAEEEWEMEVSEEEVDDDETVMLGDSDDDDLLANEFLDDDEGWDAVMGAFVEDPEQVNQ